MSPQAVLDRLRQVETLSGSPATSVRRRRLIFGGEQRGQECQSKGDSSLACVLVKQRKRREHAQTRRATWSAEPALWACGRQLHGAPSPAHCSGYNAPIVDHGSSLDSRKQGGSHSIADTAVEATGAPSASGDRAVSTK